MPKTASAVHDASVELTGAQDGSVEFPREIEILESKKTRFFPKGSMGDDGARAMFYFLRSQTKRLDQKDLWALRKGEENSDRHLPSDKAPPKATVKPVASTPAILAMASCSPGRRQWGLQTPFQASTRVETRSKCSAKFSAGADLDLLLRIRPSGRHAYGCPPGPVRFTVDKPGAARLVRPA